jgi:hypothetical protein
MEAKLHDLLIQEFHGDGAIGVELGVLGLQLHLAVNWYGLSRCRLLLHVRYIPGRIGVVLRNLCDHGGVRGLNRLGVVGELRVGCQDAHDQVGDTVAGGSMAAFRKKALREYVTARFSNSLILLIDAMMVESSMELS